MTASLSRIDLSPAAPGTPVGGAPRLILMAEGAAVLVAAAAAYGQTGASWWLFAALFLVPDLFMLGYLRGPRLGALVYDLGHSYVVTLAVVALGWGLTLPLLLAVGLVWTAHVGFDRLLGFGLKFASGFGATHLGR